MLGLIAGQGSHILPLRPSLPTSSSVHPVTCSCQCPKTRTQSTKTINSSNAPPRDSGSPKARGLLGQYDHAKATCQLQNLPVAPEVVVATPYHTHHGCAGQGMYRARAQPTERWTSPTLLRWVDQDLTHPHLPWPERTHTISFWSPGSHILVLCQLQGFCDARACFIY